MNLQAMMKQAQTMQKDMTKAKEEVDAMTFSGTSSIVEVKVNGKKEVLEIKIKNKENFDLEDLSILEDMLIVAFNDAFKQVDKAKEEKLSNYAGLSDLF